MLLVNDGRQCLTRLMAIDKQGYVVLRRFLDVEECRRARCLASSFAPAADACERPNNTLLPLRWLDPLVELVLGDDNRRDAVAVAARARDLRWTSGYISRKDARTGAVAWHQDWWCWDHPASLDSRPCQVALLVYLCATAQRSGALRVLPESHLRWTPLHEALYGDPTDAQDGGPTWIDDDGRGMTLELDEGDAVLLDYRLLHGTHPNDSTTTRDCVVLNFSPCWAELPFDIQGHLVQGWGLPTEAETDAARRSGHLLPRFTGLVRDLPMNRVPPTSFVCGAAVAAFPSQA